jgi:2'-5' RNA ligase/uncharacterized protein (UPF0248 family)
MTRREPQRDEGEPQRKLRTSREVYDQIRWDPRLDPAAFVIGYETRDAGIQEIDLPSFDPQGEIPWHRVQHIRQGEVTVWDRRERLDLLDGPRRAPPAPAPSGLDARPVHRSAVALIPPRRVWAPIEAIRQEFDKHVERWMPHINLLYGFLPEGAFAQASRVMAEALRDVPPFTVTLDELRRFQHRSGTTVWLHPRCEPEGALHALQAKLEALFPQCTDQSRASSSGFTPHLSIAQFQSAEEAEAHMAAWRDILPIAFPVRAVQLISRREDEPFEVRHEIPLGAGSSPTFAS